MLWAIWVRGATSTFGSCSNAVLQRQLDRYAPIICVVHPRKPGKVCTVALSEMHVTFAFFFASIFYQKRNLSVTTRLRKHQALLRASAIGSDDKIKRKCKACTAIFYSHRIDAQTCSVRCRQRWHRNTGGKLELMHWYLSDRTDQLVRVLADRHYYRKNPNSPQFTPPGKCVVFHTANYDAFWITNAPFTQYIRHRWPGAWTCIAFRNESPFLSSALITQAVAASLFLLKTPPAVGFITFVNSNKVRSPNPGYCFKRAGWKHIGFTKGNLHVLQLLPEAFPTPIAPIS